MVGSRWVHGGCALVATVVNGASGSCVDDPTRGVDIDRGGDVDREFGFRSSRRVARRRRCPRAAGRCGRQRVLHQVRHGHRFEDHPAGRGRGRRRRRRPGDRRGDRGRRRLADGHAHGQRAGRGARDRTVRVRGLAERQPGDGRHRVGPGPRTSRPHERGHDGGRADGRERPRPRATGRRPRDVAPTRSG